MRRLLLMLIAASVALSACGGVAGPEEDPAGVVDVEVHRTTDCSCCVLYENYLMEQGFRVRTTAHPDLAAFREAVGVPPQLLSCHTSIVAGYYVEGHVPVDDIRRLLDETPKISGIALPGMPPGSPGMGGALIEPLVIYAVNGDQAWIFNGR